MIPQVYNYIEFYFLSASLVVLNSVFELENAMESEKCSKRLKIVKNLNHTSALEFIREKVTSDWNVLTLTFKSCSSNLFILGLWHSSFELISSFKNIKLTNF